jgi:putative ATPase
MILGRRDYPGGRSFSAVLGNLLDEETDGIVNAANGWLAHGGGVAAAQAAAAGPARAGEGGRLVKARGPLPTGSAALTTAGRLPFKGVIHAVGPRRGEGREEEQLVSALRAAFEIADDRGWASLSFPAVSAGIFAVPAEVCARAYLRAADRFYAEHPATPLLAIRLVVFDGPVADEMRRLLR